ncbi:hypothetical protein PNI0159_00916 [Streptococcus pneumoniae PNI0159]|nr:hypothetical protein PNI0159_00916 [Streptococcus pneumoniae PNI0159]
MIKALQVVDKTDEVSSKYSFEVVVELTKSAQNTEVVDRTDEVNSKYCFEVVDKTDKVSHIYTARRS